MRGAILHAPRDVRVEERADPKITEPTDAVIRLAATCVCGSDLWPYRGIEAVDGPTPMGHEPGLGEEPVDEGGPVLGALEPVLDDRGPLVDVGGSEVAEAAFHVRLLLRRHRVIERVEEGNLVVPRGEWRVPGVGEA